MPAVTKTKYVVMAGLDDVPHYSPEKKAEMLAGYQPHEREARAKGIPVLGSGRIFTYDEKEISYKPFVLPEYFARLNGIDFGWDHPTAVAFGAHDRDNDIIYIYDIIKRRTALPEVIAEGIKRRGKWIPVAWPHDGEQTSKDTGVSLAQRYQSLGVNMLKNKATNPAPKGAKEGTGGNSVEASIIEMQSRFETGRLKIAEHLEDFWFEYRLYHRKDGKIEKVNDDAISACLHPDTVVITDKGNKRIQELVGTEGRVLTIGGQMANYKHCRLTRKKAQLVKVTFSDGYELFCTPDHKLLNEAGEWIQASNATGANIQNARAKQCKSLFTLKEENIQDLETIIVQASVSCIGIFTKQSMAKFLKAIISTTKTGIQKITTLATLNALTGKSTYQNTAKVMGDTLIGFTSHKRNGRKAKKANNFLSNVAKKMFTSYGNLKAIVANNAAKPLKQWLEKINFALTIAGQQVGESQGLIMSKQIANYAEAYLPKTNTQKQNIAAVHAVGKAGYQQKQGNNTLKILRVESAGQSDVYCMAVEGTEAFAVENGAIVHNCRYLMMMIRYAKIRPQNRNEPPMTSGTGFYL